MTLVYVPPTQLSTSSAAWNNPFTTTTSSNITTLLSNGTGGMGTGTGSGGVTGWINVPAPWPPHVTAKSLLDNIRAGDELTVGLPDGARLIVERSGNYKIEDKNAKITYKANRVREFNTYLNASDRLEDFIRYCKGFDISQHEMVDLPIKLFIMWLITEAASADQLPPNDSHQIEDIKRLNLEIKRKHHPRCKCGRFIHRTRAAQGFMFCNGLHYDKYNVRGNL